MKVTKRVGFSWDQDFKHVVNEIRRDLVGYGSDNGGEPSSTELFLLFMAIGYREGVKRPKPASKSDGPRLEFIKPDQKSLIKAIALAESEDSEILLDEDALYDIAEQFAAGGLAILAKMREKPNFPAWLKGELLKMAREGMEAMNGDRR